ncbi:5-formyltetrahydrofolate cyclo-ligase [Jannaschia ovalis]|uniref:5-formyltetrahydrofolate cyclo-ligase n=1 Tax=Jannaschia ovalis TaxID=3038773 RepID=A0ABY8LCI5_9RHOB|nr:5-formyltetrahydrofolate cyclo-ligase [Jannaschia sp. GRR-S6-38]WGH79045.1 5-formyltetrahydrofolate cyclo-ligase [Jannaschia sp. GRR-S6-38]
MDADANPDAAKAQSRKACLAARDGVGRLARAAAATRLFARLMHLRDRTIAGYLPIGSEADPRGAMRALFGANRICVPVVTAKGAPLRFREWWPGCALEEGAFGVPVPTEGGWRVPDLLIVPLVGFDADCARLGYGGGFYDRTLAGMGDAQTIGFGFEAQRLDRVPRGPHDVALDAVITEAGVYHPPASD